MREQLGLTFFAEASPASPTPSPARGGGRRTRAGSGHGSRRPSPQLALPSFSSRTCQACGTPACETCWPTLPGSGSMRNGIVSVRVTSEPPTGDSDSSFWPTPTAHPNANRTATEPPSVTDGRGRGRHLSAAAVATMWPTPAARDFKSGESNLHGTNARPLNEVAVGMARGLWPTPAATPYGTNQGGSAGRVGPIRESLDTMARHWPTPTAGDSKSSGGRTYPGSKMHPGTSLTDAVVGSINSRRGPRTSGDGPVLNPQFVEALMGLPDRWTAV